MYFGLAPPTMEEYTADREYLGEEQPILPNLSDDDMRHPDLGPVGNAVVHPELVVDDEIDPAAQNFAEFVDAAAAGHA